MDGRKIISMTIKGACELLPERDPAAHKGSFGSLLITAGSVSYTGAACLCTLSALRCGVGLVCLATVREAAAAAGALCPEATFLSLRESSLGMIRAEEAPAIRRRAEHAGAMLIGCGLGQSGDTRELVKALLGAIKCPAVVDADGLNVICDSPELLYGRVITPHVGEMSRLCGKSADAIKADPVGTAADFAARYGCVVVLKDADTVAAAPDGRVFFHTGRNSGMARGGSGDVLAGMLASLTAQGMEPFNAAMAAVTLHGEAGRRCAERFSNRAMLPHQLPDMLCEIFLENGL